mgnify:CR=1 FL=1
MSNPVPLRPATYDSVIDLDVQISGTLRRLVDGAFGVGRRYSYEQAAELLSCKVSSLRDIAAGVKHARLGLGLAIAGLIGPAAVNTLLAEIGYLGARRQDDDDEAKPFETLAALNSTSATLATALADGRLDHRERPACAQALRELGSLALEQAADLERSA